MDDSNNPRNKHTDHLGVNKISKNIRKTPILSQSIVNPVPARPVSQPQVYNINKSDFRNIVQQLTGSPSHHSQPPPVNHHTTRLHRIRPPPLSPINITRPRVPVPLNNNNNNSNQFGQLVQRAQTAESPISSYMRYLQHSINESGNPQGQSAGLLPNPRVPLLPPPRTNGPPPLLPSPSGYLNLPSPRSPYPLLSPGYQYPPPLSPNFPFSPGILGPGPQAPWSPGISFPLSPGFFPCLSPRWRD